MNGAESPDGIVEYRYKYIAKSPFTVGGPSSDKEPELQQAIDADPDAEQIIQISSKGASPPTSVRGTTLRLYDGDGGPGERAK